MALDTMSLHLESLSNGSYMITNGLYGSSNKHPQRLEAYHVLAIQSDSKGFKAKL